MGSIENCKILIADDMATMRKIFIKMLKEMVYTIIREPLNLPFRPRRNNNGGDSDP